MLGVLDTSVVVSGLDPDEIPADRRPKGFAVSAVTLAELHYGVLVAPGPERIHRIKRLLAVQRTFTVLRIEEDVAQSYGLIAAAAAAKALNRSPRARVMDLLIAASAHAYNAVVVTRNPEDFRTYGDLVEVIALGPRPGGGPLPPEVTG